MSDRWAKVAEEGLALPGVASDATGRGVRVAVVDTGVNFDHPHLADLGRGSGAPRGLSIAWSDGELAIERGVHRDLYGHGTCCAALLHLLAPGADLFAVRVTGDRATTDADRLARGISAAVEEGAHVIAIALGTTTVLRAGLDDAVAAALGAGAVLVASDPNCGSRPGEAGPSASAPSGVLPARLAGEAGPTVSAQMLPARCPGAVAVGHRDGVDVVLAAGPDLERTLSGILGTQPTEGSYAVVAEGRARPAPGLARNFWGASLATARTAAALARLAEASGDRGAALRRGFKKALVVL